MMRKIIVGIFAGLLICGIVAVLVLMSRTPRTDRAWADYLEYTATTTVDSAGIAHISRVRDFTYGDGAVVGRAWLSDVAIDPARIVRMWFVLEPFAQWKAVGHTFLTFELDNGSAYSFSVEARMENGEKYSALKGFFREYELSYTWGTERDFLTRRLLYLEHPVRMYPLAVTREGAQELFITLLDRTNDLAEHPRFYNTLTANCTNLLAHLANETSPGTVPWDISWHLPGYSDHFLMKIGLIATEGTADETQEKYDLTPYRAAIDALETRSAGEFSAQLRALLPSQ